MTHFHQKLNLSAIAGIALREVMTEAGPADHILFVNSKKVGAVEAKAENFGHKLFQAEKMVLARQQRTMNWRVCC